MSGKRRTGRRSGSFASQGATPAGGLPAPGVTHALETMAAQLEAFAKEVGDLKALLSDVASRSAGARSNETTLDLELAHFRRLRRWRLYSFIAVPLLLAAMIVLALSIYGRSSAPPSSDKNLPAKPSLLPASRPVTPAGTGNGGTALSDITPVQGPSSAPKQEGLRTGSIHRKVRRSPVQETAVKSSELPSRTALPPPLPISNRPAPELSGGAPILD